MHDFVRQPTILDYFVLDSALLGLDACAGRNHAGIDAHTIVAQPQNAIVRSVRPDTLGFRRQLEKVAAALASFLVRCCFGVARGRLWRKAAVHGQSELVTDKEWVKNIASHPSRHCLDQRDHMSVTLGASQ